MKTRAALTLSVAGILAIGSAALAVNTQVLNTAPAGTGSANSVLLPNNSVRTPAPAAVASADAKPAARSLDSKGGTVTRKSDAGPAAPQPVRTISSQPDAGPAASQPGHTAAPQPAPAVVSAQPGDDKDGLRSAPEPRDDRGGQRKASEPGDDSGEHGSDD